MKITEMLQREDFYQINRDTLSEYYGNCAEKKKLYIYPRLNAIVVKHPSKAVEEYLLTEYDVRGNALKRLAVQMYVKLCLNSFGRMADQSIELNNSATPNTLIYPCNRKYRIFDFVKQTVSVQIKSGFPTEQLRHEIAFRTRKDLPGFVPTLVSHTAFGYTERIIDGRPLARITDDFEKYKRAAFDQLSAYANQFNETVTGNDYAVKLSEKANKLAKEIDIDLKSLLKSLVAGISKLQEIVTTFSHGDLQMGNIWIENKTNKVFIIDWESWGTRSSFYDKAALFNGLRPGDISKYLNKEGIATEEKAVVLLEDLVFQLEEYSSLPGQFGLEKLKKYIEKVQSWCQRT